MQTTPTRVSRRPLALSVTEVARLIGVWPITLYRAIERGEIPAIHVGGSKRIHTSWLEDQFGMPYERIMAEAGLDEEARDD